MQSLSSIEPSVGFDTSYPHTRLDHTVEAQQGNAGPWTEPAAELERFKKTLLTLEQAAMADHGAIPEAAVEELSRDFVELSHGLNLMIGDNGTVPQELRRETGAQVQQELLPYLLKSELAERIYTKPRGYAGDFMTIEIMYRDQARGSGRLGPVLDRALRRHPANLAVMARRGVLAEQIRETLHTRKSLDETGPTRITSLAAGPAAELFDVFETLSDPGTLKATCIDIDSQALAFVGDKRDRLGLQHQIELFKGNLIHLAMGRRSLELPPQDLVYSIGLIDYFSDKYVVLLLNYIYDRLAPGGRVILGNFHPDNPDKALMDHVLDWRLIHRTEDDMNRLFVASKFAAPCTRILFEQQGVNLFAEGVKAATAV